MGATALVLSEVILSLEGEPNFTTAAEATLGKWAKGAVAALYLFFFYCLMVAYLSGIGGLLNSSMGWSAPFFSSSLVAGVTFLLVFAGLKVVERCNGLLMFGMGLSFALFLLLGMKEVESEKLMAANWTELPRAFPISFIAFAFQGIIPTIVRSLDRDRKAIRKAVLIGVALPLVSYIAWHILVAGVVPQEALLRAKTAEQSAIQPLTESLQEPTVATLGAVFGFFALATSLLGVAFAIRDFIADGLQLERIGRGRWMGCFLAIFPPLVIAYFYPELFLTALEYAGGIGTALLLGLLPIAMGWRIRDGVKWRLLLLLLAFFILFEVACQLRFV